jgi:dolichyl-diphosphooligosaccharide---protein glycosyltransferase
LNSQTSLFQISSFDFKINHLFVIGILILAFSVSFLIRAQPAEYGFELNEFDPFYNFRATEYIVENGFIEYFQWHDDKSWYLPSSIENLLGQDFNCNDCANPERADKGGRNVSTTSQVMLHLTAAITYQIFGSNLSLYDFTILFPAIIGSLTVVVIFALVRLFAGTTAGLFASLLFAVSLPIIIRGSIGWFKSEPLGIFYGLLGLYLFLSAINSKNKKIAFSKIIFGGIVMTFALTSWGGNQFFLIPMGLFILALPFVRKDHKFLLWSIPLFAIVFILTSSMFERPGPSFVYSLSGLSLIVPTIFLISSIFIQKISKDKNKIRNSLLLLISIIIIGSFLVIINEESNILSLPSFRYLNAVNPFLTTNDPLVDSVAEHATPTISQSYLFHSVLLIFSGLGAWFLLSKKSYQSKIIIKNDMKIFVLIMGITGVYVSSSFIRLEVFASISLIILSSIALSILTKEIFKINLSNRKSHSLKISYVLVIFTLFMVPLFVPANSNWISAVDVPPTILTGATNHPASNDWLDTLEWIKTNTPENSIVASWWDYGYWIQTMSERTTIIDNATIGSWQISKIAQTFLSNPDEGWNILQNMNVDYLVVFIAGERLDAKYNDEQIYYLAHGGDESKIPWFVRIAELPHQKYLESDSFTKTDYFWNETLLGKIIPFNTITYYNSQLQLDSQTYEPGFIPLSVKEIKYNDSKTDPLWLVYASPSFYDEKPGSVTGVFVYQINKNYIPINDDLRINQRTNLEN